MYSRTPRRHPVPLLPAPLALMEAHATRLASPRRGANIFCCRMEIMSARCENLHKVNEKNLKKKRVKRNKNETRKRPENAAAKESGKRNV